MLTEEDRALGHRLAAGWLERAGETEALVLAEHWERGGERERAARAYLGAARKALGGGDFGAALERAGRGDACGAAGELAGELLLVRAEAHKWRGEHTEAAAGAAGALALL